MLSRARALWRSARTAPGLSRILAAFDRLWWARTIRRADVVDLDVVAAQLGKRVSARAAIRRYVRGGFRSGFTLNALVMERTVSRQLSDADRVPALYAYLVNDQAQLRTSPNWDAVGLVRAEPAALADPAGPLGYAWRRALREGAIELGNGDARVQCSWGDVVSSFTAPLPGRRSAMEPQTTDRLAFRCVIGASETDPDMPLELAAFAANELDAHVDLVVADASYDVALQARILSIWSGGVVPRRAAHDQDLEPPAEVSATRSAFRGPDAALSPSDLRTLVAEASRGPVSALWVRPSGVVASAGVLTHDGHPFPLLAGHPVEDARRAGAEILVPVLDGPARAWPSGTSPNGPGRTLTGVVVTSSEFPHHAQPVANADLDVDVDAALRPAGLAIARWQDHRPVLRRVLGDESSSGGLSLRWAIKTSAPAGQAGESWGDTHFARGLAAALERLGQQVVIDSFGARDRESAYLDDVVLVLRGPHAIDPPAARTKMIWVISHPDEITAEELAPFDRVFAASAAWARASAARLDRRVEVLLQCTDATRFRPAGLPRTDDIVFVGTARGIARPVVVDPLRHGIPVRVYGPDWRGYIPASAIAATGIPNTDLPVRYETAAVVLNDHWDAMRREGFISNRLFDVVAAGGRAISDAVDGIDQTFQGAVRTYSSPAELISLLRGDLDGLFPDATTLASIGAAIRQRDSFDARAVQLLAAAYESRGVG